MFVLGEFPWQIRVGDTTTGSDYVAPPLMLSAEVDADKEVTWSLGRYVGGDEIWTQPVVAGQAADDRSASLRISRHRFTA